MMSRINKVCGDIVCFGNGGFGGQKWRNRIKRQYKTVDKTPKVVPKTIIFGGIRQKQKFLAENAKNEIHEIVAN